MRALALSIVILAAAGCSATTPPLLEPGVACRQSSPCASASSDRCFDGCNTCSCQSGQLSCTLLACDTGTAPDAGP